MRDLRATLLLFVGLSLGLLPTLPFAKEGNEAKPELFQLELLPQWELKEIGEDKFGCYSADGIRTLRKIDIQFKLSLDELVTIKTINEQLADAIKLRTDVNKLFEANVLIREQLLTDKNETIKNLTDKLVKVESRVQVSDVVLPIVLGTLALVALAFLGGYLTAEHYNKDAN